MELISVSFLAFVIGVIALSNCFPSVTGRRMVLAFSSAAFIASYADSITHWSRCSCFWCCALAS